MTFRSVSRLGSLTVAAYLCLGHADNGGCGGKEEEEYEHGGSPTGTLCPSASELTAQNFGTAFIQTHCVSCHSKSVTGTARAGATVGVDFDTLDEVRRQRALIDTHAAVGPNASNTEMPPASRPQPTQEEREKLGQWLACGAP